MMTSLVLLCCLPIVFPICAARLRQHTSTLRVGGIYELLLEAISRTNTVLANHPLSFA
ncbi:hypothetical protein M422DRAFT_28346 [Sphaerobolus stellatus SS14]|nr:hypothetical protein M422DRAFT_28346 [Sphaerobolus stellatus SS14]